MALIGIHEFSKSLFQLEALWSAVWRTSSRGSAVGSAHTLLLGVERPMKLNLAEIKSLVGSVLFVIACGGGFAFLTTESRPEKQWVPAGHGKCGANS